MADPKTYHFDLPESGRPTHAALAEEWYPGIQSAALNASRKRSVDAIKGIRAVVIHATAGTSSAGAASVIFDKAASFHWLVPDEDEPQHQNFVWATCHEARRAWHVGGSKSHPAINGGKTNVNNWSLGIEVVNAVRSSDQYSDWQIQATAEIVRYCWAKYPNLKHVCSHAMLDPTRRTDPGAHFPWDRFRDLVLHAPETVLPPLVAQGGPRFEGLNPSGCCMDVGGRSATEA